MYIPVAEMHPVHWVTVHVGVGLRAVRGLGRCGSCTLVCTIENHNFPGDEQPSGLTVKQSPNAQGIFQPITGPTSWAGGP